jgi:hypothetical protein
MVSAYKIFGMLMMAELACQHPYEAPPIPTDARALVVEGLINTSHDASTIIMLSRVQELSASNLPKSPELNAVVMLESDDGSLIPLYDVGTGSYVADHLSLASYRNYRLDITTQNGNKYQSDFVLAKKTPTIDSLEWNQNSDVTIYVNTHDPLDSTIYYRWEYEETWNYLSNLASPWAVANGMIYAKDSLTQTDSCWRTFPSSNIIVGSSLALNKDVISHFALTSIPFNSEQISNRYSILVKQYALSKGAYEFYQILKKNTQETGSLFDPQPQNLPTNIHCLTNPSERVIGFACASSIEEKRIFIDHKEVKWKYSGVSPDCTHFIYTHTDPNDYRIFNFPDTNYVPYYFDNNGSLILVYRGCTDCKYYGGTNVKPTYWQ